MPKQAVYTKQSLRDLKSIPKQTAARIIEKIEAYADDKPADVKRLTLHEPGWRLRVGEYRVLFDLEGSRLTIYRVKHRKQAYR